MKTKNCPFCGGKAEINKTLKFFFEYARGFYVDISCMKCYAKIDQGSFFVLRKKKETIEQNIERVTQLMEVAIISAVKDWNRRV